MPSQKFSSLLMFDGNPSLARMMVEAPVSSGVGAFTAVFHESTEVADPSPAYQPAHCTYSFTKASTSACTSSGQS